MNEDVILFCGKVSDRGQQFQAMMGGFFDDLVTAVFVESESGFFKAANNTEPTGFDVVLHSAGLERVEEILAFVKSGNNCSASFDVLGLHGRSYLKQGEVGQQTLSPRFYLGLHDFTPAE